MDFHECPRIQIPMNKLLNASHNHAKKILKQASNSLHDWIQPNLPEDLSFIKNHKPWLINTSHEYESYIETEEEYEIDKIIKIEDFKVRL